MKSAVFSIVLNLKPPFFVSKSAKKRPTNIFPKAPQFWSKAPQFETFSIWDEVENDTPYHFYVTISFRATQNYKTIQILILSQDFSSKWFKNLPASKNFWRPGEAPTRHFGAKPPLLKTLKKN